MTFDTIIRNGLILDGSGKDGFYADIAISQGKIQAIGTGITGADTVIDARGLAVSPGWIDAHSHSDNAILTFPDMKEKTEQGITLSIAGQCGTSIAPAQALSMAQLAEQAGPLGSGVAFLVGHGNLRRMVMGTENRDPSPGEMAQMEDLLVECLSAGALGMSMGLYYIPGCYAKQAELIRLSKIVADHGKVITAHLRDEGDQLVEAVREIIEIARESGCRTVISHHKAAWKQNWGKIHTTLSMIDAANENGCDIYLDVYPYTASATLLAARFVPGSMMPVGTRNRMEVLSDPKMREKFRQWGHEQWGNDLGFTVISSCPAMPQYNGLDLNTIADLQNEPDRVDAALELLMACECKAYAYFFMMDEQDVQAVLKHPRAMVCTDSSVAGNQQFYHPRLRGAFPRALRKYVRQEGLVSLPEMIRKFTSLPAFVYGLTNKGRIAEGMDADLCIFDPDTVADGANYGSCQLPNRGLRYVLISGQIVVREDQATGCRPGKLYI